MTILAAIEPDATVMKMNHLDPIRLGPRRASCPALLTAPVEKRAPKEKP